MTKMTTKVKTQKSEKVWFFLGALAVFFMGVPYLVLGKDSVFVYHDQLDGEVIAYLLQAKHLWDGSGVLPEFMNGAAKTALTMPAPACVLLYRWLPAELALACMQVAGSFAGYLGMFCLLGWAGETSETLRRRKGLVGFIAMLTGCMYAYLPFLPVYGLSQYGLPLLMYCVLRLGEKDRPKKFRILCYFYVLLFGCNSSLVLSGFAVLGIWGGMGDRHTGGQKETVLRRTGCSGGFCCLRISSRTVRYCFSCPEDREKRFLTNRNIYSARWTFSVS